VALNLQLLVNGRAVAVDVDERSLLVQVLREELHLTGTHVGCDTAQCGACTVHLDGRAVKACSILALQAQGKSVVTIEGLAGSDSLHRVQQAFHDLHGLQCGFCTPGMVMSACHLLAQNPSPNEAQVREALEGNVCRCTGYQNIVGAILSASQAV
jgi:aerobic carbon-monoxide dehydrogenase small subunit